jgi:hypothetical protein
MVFFLPMMKLMVLCGIRMLDEYHEHLVEAIDRNCPGQFLKEDTLECP